MFVKVCFTFGKVLCVNLSETRRVCSFKHFNVCLLKNRPKCRLHIVFDKLHMFHVLIVFAYIENFLRRLFATLPFSPIRHCAS